MFAIDRRVQARLEPVLKRTLIVEPNQQAARLLSDIVRGLGARDVRFAASNGEAVSLAAALEPGIVFSEFSGPELNGPDLVRKLRRSNLACRRAPVIMVATEATPSAIRGARDSGVHEFLRKPFTSADLFRRIENVAQKPRDWIEGVAYVGPDRRRFNSGDYQGPAKRRNDKAVSAADAVAGVREQALRILSAALSQFDDDPVQALRAVREQTSQLKALALSTADTNLAVAVSALDLALVSGAPTTAVLRPPITALLNLYPIEELKRAS